MLKAVVGSQLFPLSKVQLVFSNVFVEKSIHSGRLDVNRGKVIVVASSPTFTVTSDISVLEIRFGQLIISREKEADVSLEDGIPF